MNWDEFTTPKIYRDTIPACRNRLGLPATALLLCIQYGVGQVIQADLVYLPPEYAEQVTIQMNLLTKALQ